MINEFIIPDTTITIKNKLFSHISNIIKIQKKLYKTERMKETEFLNIEKESELREINKIVYSLYKLNNEESKIIEEVIVQ